MNRSDIIKQYSGQSLPELSYATVRDFCDSADHLSEIMRFNGDLKDVQRTWAIKTIVAKTPIGSKLLEIGAGEPLVAEALRQLGYQVTIVDPYDGSGNGPETYEAYVAKYPDVKIVRSYFGENIAGLKEKSFDCIYSVSVLEHVPDSSMPDVFAGVRKYLRPGGVSAHCIDHVLTGPTADRHEAKVRQVLVEQTKLQNPQLDDQTIRPEIDRKLVEYHENMSSDVETYYHSAQGHNLWRGRRPYDEVPYARIASTQTVVSKSLEVTSEKDRSQQLPERSTQTPQPEIVAEEEIIRRLQSENRRLTRQLASVEMELAQWKNGLAFRMLDRYHHAIERLLPTGSRQRGGYDTALRWVHAALLGGTNRRTPSGTAPDTVAADDVIVYQMGKVGSITVAHSLRYYYGRVASPVQVHHVHLLNHLDEAESELKRQSDPRGDLESIQGWQRVRNLIDQNPQKRWKVISLVRDPVARSVAWFFHKLDYVAPDWQAQREQGPLFLEELQRKFLDTDGANPEIPDHWFNTQLLPIFGIDVFAEPFPKDVGYKIYEQSPRASLLIFRLEDLNECAGTAMSQFLGLNDFSLVHSNVADDKDYAEVYRAFKRLPLPQSFVDAMYSTRFARHFYTEQELERLTQSWTGANKN